jgi:hypothetical protein
MAVVLKAPRMAETTGPLTVALRLAVRDREEAGLLAAARNGWHLSRSLEQRPVHPGAFRANATSHESLAAPRARQTVRQVVKEACTAALVVKAVAPLNAARRTPAARPAEQERPEERPRRTSA